MTVNKNFSNIMSTCNIICAILIIFIHTYNINVYSNVASHSLYWLEEIISQGIARGAVPFFFISSAFFLYGSKKKTVEVYRTRFKSVVLPYLLWNTFYMIAFTVLKYFSLSNSGMTNFTIGNILSGIFLHKYNYTYWFMKYLIICILLYPLIIWIFNRTKIIPLIGAIALLIAYYVGIDSIDSFIFYYIGAIIGFYYKEYAEKIASIPKKYKIIILLIVSLLSALSFVLTNVFLFNLSLVRDFTMAMWIFFVVATFNIKACGILVSSSFMIYSMHPIILEAIEKLAYKALPHTSAIVAIIYLTAPIICLGIILTVCMILKKLSPHSYKVLNGNRQ